MEADDKSQHVGKGMADADSDKMLVLGSDRCAWALWHADPSIDPMATLHY